MNKIFALCLQHLLEPEYLLAILGLHVALLSSTLIFIGFVQVALSNSLESSTERLVRQVNNLVSKRIIRLVRIVVGISVIGALSGWISFITDNAIAAIISSILFLIALVVVGNLSYSITHEFLFLHTEFLDSDEE